MTIDVLPPRTGVPDDDGDSLVRVGLEQLALEANGGTAPDGMIRRIDPDTEALLAEVDEVLEDVNGPERKIGGKALVGYGGMIAIGRLMVQPGERYRDLAIVDWPSRAMMRQLGQTARVRI